MANMWLVCLLELIVFCPLLTGINGADVSHEFFSSGENVRLPCNNALSDCTTTTWIYSRDSVIVELVNLGIKKNDTEKPERLSLGSDCSLNIRKVTEEDYGLYNCRQYVEGKQQGDDAHVYLHGLQVSSSPSQTEISPGRSVTLSCQLYFYGVSCNDLVNFKGVELMWVNQSGVNLNTDSRYQISFSSYRCILTLTTTLLKEDHNREWRCQLTQGNQLKTTVTYTVKYSDLSFSLLLVIGISVVFAAFAVVIAGVLIHKKRAANKRAPDVAVVNDVNDHKQTYETINMPIPSAPNTNEQTDDLTYTEVMSTSKNPVKMEHDHSYDRVTYATVRGTESVPQDELYASVNK